MDVFCYVSYEDIKDYQSLTDSESGDDNLLREMCRSASRMWDGFTNRHFAPWRETRYYDYEAEKGDALGMSARARQHYFTDKWASVLKVDEDLLEVKTLQTANGGTTISADDYLLKCGRRYNLQPYDRIELKTNGTTTVFSFTGTYQKANSVDAIWGYHDNWSNAWRDTQDSVQDSGGIDATVTTITVTDVDGADLFGITPRFKVDTLIKVDDEYLFVTAKDTDANTLTVIRGVNGTTAAAHDAGTTIYVYQPMQDVWHAVRRLATWIYGQKDSPFFETQVNQQLGTITIPASAPPDVRNKAMYYMRHER